MFDRKLFRENNLINIILQKYASINYSVLYETKCLNVTSSIFRIGNAYRV